MRASTIGSGDVSNKSSALPNKEGSVRKALDPLTLLLTHAIYIANGLHDGESAAMRHRQSVLLEPKDKFLNLYSFLIDFTRQANYYRRANGCAIMILSFFGVTDC